MEPPGPSLAGGVEPWGSRALGSGAPSLLTPSASAGARLSTHLSSRALTPACPTQKWPLPRGLLGYRQCLRFPGTPPSFPFHFSANLGGQSCLMDFSPISPAQLWWRLGPADQPEIGTELGATNWAAEAPIHTNPISSPLCRLLRHCFLESNLHFWVSSQAPDNLSLLQMKNKKHTDICFAAPDDDGQLDSSGAGW